MMLEYRILELLTSNVLVEYKIKEDSIVKDSGHVKPNKTYYNKNTNQNYLIKELI